MTAHDDTTATAEQPLRLRRETLRALTTAELRLVAGGRRWTPRTYVCTT